MTRRTLSSSHPDGSSDFFIVVSSSATAISRQRLAHEFIGSDYRSELQSNLILPKRSWLGLPYRNLGRSARWVKSEAAYLVFTLPALLRALRSRARRCG